MAVDRSEPATTAPERAMLDGWLDYHRATLEMKCEALTPDQLRDRSVPPSGLALLGLVRHMAEVERHWFRNIFAGEESPPLFFTEEDPDGDFNDLESVEPEEVFSTWHAECQHAKEISERASLDDIAETKRRTGEQFSLRWIVTHMIEEYARHNGHADLLREAIDGTTGD